MVKLKDIIAALKKALENKQFKQGLINLFTQSEG